MPDAFASVRVGEKLPLYGSLTAETGHNVQIQGTPTWALYDGSGTRLAGTVCDGFDGPSQQVVRAWYDFDSTGYAEGRYVFTFSITADGDDGIRRIREPSITVEIESVTG